MFTIIGIMLTGMLVGYLLRSKRLLWIHKVITLLIWLLLFLLGIDVGGNETIIRSLAAIGLEALASHSPPLPEAYWQHGDCGTLYI